MSDPPRWAWSRRLLAVLAAGCAADRSCAWHAAKFVQNGQQRVVHFLLYSFLGLLTGELGGLGDSSSAFLLLLSESFLCVFLSLFLPVVLQWGTNRFAAPYHSSAKGAGREGCFDALELFAALLFGVGRECV